MLRGMPRLVGRIGASLGAFGRITRNHALLRTTVAFAIFNAVEIGEWTAILVYAYTATGPESVGAVAVLQLVPAALLAPLLSGVGDRYRRDLALTGTYVAQVVLIGATGLAILASVPVPVVYALAILVSISQSVPRPVQAALLPALASTPDELTASNALSSVAEGVGALAGPFAVGIVLALASVGVAFVAMAAGLVVAVLLVLRLGAQMPAHDAAASATPAASATSAGDTGAMGIDPADEPGDRSAGLLAGLRAVAADRDLLLVMALLAGRLLVYGGLEVLLVLTAIEVLGTGQSGAGFLGSAFGAGIVVGGASTIALAGHRGLAPWLGVGALVVGMQLLLVGVFPAPGSALVLLALGGIGMALIDVVGQTLLQRIAPDAVRARVFGVLEGVLLAAEALGSFLVAPAVLLLGVRGALIVFGAALPVIALVAAPRFGRLDGRVVIPVREIAILRQVSMFAPVSAAVLESAARRLVRLELPAGTAVIREGEPGDRFYVVATGVPARDQGRRRAPRDGPGRLVRRDRPAPRCAQDGDGRDDRRGRAVRARPGAVPCRGDGPARAIAEALRVASARMAARA